MKRTSCPGRPGRPQCRGPIGAAHARAGRRGACRSSSRSRAAATPFHVPVRLGEEEEAGMRALTAGSRRPVLGRGPRDRRARPTSARRRRSAEHRHVAAHAVALSRRCPVSVSTMAAAEAGLEGVDLHDIGPGREERIAPSSSMTSPACTNEREHAPGLRRHRAQNRPDVAPTGGPARRGSARSRGSARRRGRPSACGRLRALCGRRARVDGVARTQ